ncbi:F-box/LRR-repeat protein 7 [Spathaspora sp. JA1]|nr:F-box/LRR-repeat protein 7 [Spathaspora sp. JA1]
MPFRNFTPNYPSPLATSGSASGTAKIRQQEQLQLQREDNIPPDLFNLLTTFPLFKKAPKSFHSKISSQLKLVQYHPQAFIIKKGDPSYSMYWILKGSVGITSTDGESIYAELSSGSFFGEIGILFNRPRTATVIARTKVLVGVLTSDALNLVLRDYPLIERRIRHEAQERLAMQDKKNREQYQSSIVKIVPPKDNSSMLAVQATCNVPGPQLPPGGTIYDEENISIQEYIKTLPLFQNLPQDIIHQLALNVEPMVVNSFEYILNQGDDKNCNIYFIVNGEVEVLNKCEQTRIEFPLARLTSGNYFGEMSFLNNLKGITTKRIASVRSVTKCELMIVKSECLTKLCTNYPDIKEELKKLANERIKSNEAPPVPLQQEEELVQDIFRPNWNFSTSSTPVSTSVSPQISRSPSPDLRKPSTSPTLEPQPKKRKYSESLTPSSINNFQSFHTQPKQIQYIPLQKRLQLARRRKSSILANNEPLPDKLLVKCFQYLPLPTLMKLRIVSQKWRYLLSTFPYRVLDLTPWNTSITDDVLCTIIDFVQTRPEVIDISNCFHITDEGFSYMINEIGISGKITTIRMKSNWEISGMAIMDLSVASVGEHLQEIDLSNCRKVRDNVIERLLGWEQDEDVVGCKNLKILNLGYCKHLTDVTMNHIAQQAHARLESLDLTRCTTITDVGFEYWQYKTFPNLKKLSLKDCTFLSDKSIYSIANSAYNLEILNLNFCCKLTDISLEILSLNCPKLRELDCSFCGSAISDSSLVTISMNLKNLSNLVLKGCVRVTRAGIDALLSGLCPLTYLDISQCKNAHIYPGNYPAQPLKLNPHTKTAFVTAGPYRNIIEIVL